MVQSLLVVEYREKNGHPMRGAVSGLSREGLLILRARKEHIPVPVFFEGVPFSITAPAERLRPIVEVFSRILSPGAPCAGCAFLQGCSCSRNGQRKWSFPMCRS